MIGCVLQNPVLLIINIAEVSDEAMTAMAPIMVALAFSRLRLTKSRIALTAMAAMRVDFVRLLQENLISLWAMNRVTSMCMP